MPELEPVSDIKLEKDENETDTKEDVLSEAVAMGTEVVAMKKNESEAVVFERSESEALAMERSQKEAVAMERSQKEAVTIETESVMHESPRPVYPSYPLDRLPSEFTEQRPVVYLGPDPNFTYE